MANRDLFNKLHYGLLDTQDLVNNADESDGFGKVDSDGNIRLIDPLFHNVIQYISKTHLPEDIEANTLYSDDTPIEFEDVLTENSIPVIHFNVQKSVDEVNAILNNIPESVYDGNTTLIAAFEYYMDDVVETGYLSLYKNDLNNYEIWLDMADRSVPVFLSVELDSDVHYDSGWQIPIENSILDLRDCAGRFFKDFEPEYAQYSYTANKYIKDIISSINQAPTLKFKTADGVLKDIVVPANTGNAGQVLTLKSMSAGQEKLPIPNTGTLSQFNVDMTEDYELIYNKFNELFPMHAAGANTYNYTVFVSDDLMYCIGLVYDIDDNDDCYINYIAFIDGVEYSLLELFVTNNGLDYEGGWTTDAADIIATMNDTMPEINLVDEMMDMSVGYANDILTDIFNILVESGDQTLVPVWGNGGSGTDVEANPTETATETISKIKIGDTTYQLVGSGQSDDPDVTYFIYLDRAGQYTRIEYERGMSWKEFIDSEYNICNASISDYEDAVTIDDDIITAGDYASVSKHAVADDYIMPKGNYIYWNRPL